MVSLMYLYRIMAELGYRKLYLLKQINRSLFKCPV